MQTTIMKDSRIGDAWIRQACQQYPVKEILDSRGKPTGYLNTGPVRLAFCDLFAKVQYQGTGDPKYKTVMLFPPIADRRPVDVLFMRVWSDLFTNRVQRDTSGPPIAVNGVSSPINDQMSEQHRVGYTPGGIFLTAKSTRDPDCIEPDPRKHRKMMRVEAGGSRMITGEHEIYGGCWAFCVVRLYANPKYPRVATEMHQIPVIADDESFGGRVPPPDN